MRLSTFAVSMTLAFAVVRTSLGESTIDYAKDVEPIFKANCYGCHGEEKGLGRLRLHTTAAIEEALGVHDDLLAAGKPDESELYTRLVLPADDKKRMPKGADPLAEKDIETIKKWIAEGASFTVAAAAPAEPQPAPAKKEVAKRPPLEPASPEAIAAVENTGALVIPLYSGSNELRVSFPSSREQVTDETVAALVPIAGQLVELDISGTKITDASAESLEQFTNLDTLHLEKTEIGDATVAALANMTYLNYLNLYGTKVTDAALETLAGLPSLSRLYVWQTAVSYEAAKKLEQATPGLEVNLGWDHPGVVRERLSSELTRVEQQQADAAAAAAEAEKALGEAKAAQQAAEERLGEIKKQLEDLDKPAEAQPAPPAEEAKPENAAGNTT